ncbi:GNAT family N-acetyltransferase [Hoeflea sp. YIM 152468]|uniref:GNAT family N-acetyltransferase n=1 Tax=Hoeflea sp. YIM 152468 TaxID=3031759 RepID=UPI0023D9E046|nr:GNAT family N-acetyltransferase [Hoeflea sp. YIM 152468]MDF1607623.1 GNAT family N-acetyltransferase [Hoeflea sp. YIM 152468]
MTLAIFTVEGEGRDFADTVEAIIDGTAAKLGLPFEPEQLQLKACDATGELAGGLTAHTVQDWLFIKLLGIAEAQRGSGAGRALLARAEEFARQKRLVGVYLDTFAFQAPGFYQSMGYTECGRLPAVDGAAQRIWFAKTFDDTADNKI